MTENIVTETVETVETEPKAKSARINLAVPFPQRKLAKKLNAYWDRKAKVWYTYAKAGNAPALARYMSDQDKKAYGFEA